MKFIQFIDDTGNSVYISAETIIRFTSVAPHETEVACSNGDKHLIRVNAQALIARVFKESMADIIETAPEGDGYEEIIISSSMNSDENENNQATIVPLTAPDKIPSRKMRTKS